MSDPEPASVDNPIKTSGEDALGRAPLAHDFARGLRDLDAREGIVVGVLGPWGNGKTSFINLMREQLAEEPALVVVDFNPWMFSGSQQLVDFFFSEIAAELRLKGKDGFEKLAEKFDKYGDALSPLALLPWVGAWWDRASKAARAALEWRNNRRRGTRTLRDDVSEALRTLDRPIVVVVDDIDRLSTDEVRDIFKLVRLTASFPNVIYVLAFDRERVEAALDETNVPGRAYLEKIMQVTFDLPAIPQELLRSRVLGELGSVIDDMDIQHFDSDRWADVYFELVEPLLQTMRDVTRLVSSARPTLRALGTEIETVDLVAIEALRIFRPEIFAQLRRMRAALTEVSGGFGDREDPLKRAEITRLQEVAGADQDLIERIFGHLFPAAQRYTTNTSHGAGAVQAWQRQRRLAHSDYLRFYFERTAPAGLAAFRAASTAVSLATDGEAFERFLDALPPQELEDVIVAMEAYEDDFPRDGVVPASVALLNRVAAIPERPAKGMFDFNRADLVVTRVVLRLFRRLNDEVDREDAARAIVSGMSSFSSRKLFVSMIGYREGVGHKLVSEEFAATLERELTDDVESSVASLRAGEWDLLRVLYGAQEDAGRPILPSPPSNPDVARDLFQSAKSTSRSQSMGSRHLRTEDVLAWEPLLKVLGDEDALAEALGVLRAADGESTLVGLVEKYVSGWRPDRF